MIIVILFICFLLITYLKYASPEEAYRIKLVNEIGDTITYLSRYEAKNSDIIMNKNPKYATVYYNFEEANQDARQLFGQYQMYVVVEKRQSGLFGDAYQDYRSFG